MGRGTWAVLMVSGLLVLGACGGDDDSDGTGGNGGSGNAGQGAGGSSAGSSGSAAGGSSGKGGGGTTGTGTGTNAGRGGSAGGSAGSGGAGGRGDAGSGGSSATCDIACGPNERCELVAVQCFRAPCPAQPMCVAASGSGAAGSGAAGSGAAGSSGSGKPCGSRGLGQCADGEFCEFPAGADCGRADAPGTCAEQPTACTREYLPVCGCDGTTYSNKCEARAAGVSVETEGECGGMSSAGGTRCVGTVTCKALPTKCPDLQVHTIENGCYGPCVAIDECQCSGPADCPDSNQYTCFMSAKHCGPYV